LVVTQFLGAFNDNLFKQLILLLSITPVAFHQLGQAPALALWVFVGPLTLAALAPALGPTVALATLAAFDPGLLTDQQGLANVVFALPFILTTGYAGYLSDRYGKREIIVLCKVAEIVVMAAGAAAFAYYSQTRSLSWLYVVLFFMGAQSGFFGPAKYGILPEMLHARDLPQANGVMLTTTFLAIILGQFVAGVLLEDFRAQLWLGSATCVLIAVVGTLSSFWVRPVPRANPQLRFEWSALAIPTDLRRHLGRDRQLLTILLVSSLFWLIAGMVNLAINALGIIELHVGEKANSYLLAVVSIGIAGGGAIGGFASGHQVDFRVLRVGAIGMVACLLLLAVPTLGGAQLEARGFDQLFALPGIGESRQWLGYFGSMAALVALGVFTGMFAIPMQVFMQSRPPEGMKGRMIAAMNLVNWIGIAASGAIYGALAGVIEARGWPRCTMFLFLALLTLPIALFYHPRNEPLRDVDAEPASPSRL
jgi:acyl-[acyl-carrier-protein]-phospholipid O-acyltransferase/long-chain-fatty-acid--[acyl-carrier-protein] ligase